jgi:peptide/nickel transport system ATP-binding protein
VRPEGRTGRQPVLRTRRVGKTFNHGGHAIPALADVELTLRSGETLGLVGESGSGKSTLARLMLGLTAPDAGSVVELDGERLAPIVTKRGRRQVQALQIVFQNPDAALNRRWSVHRILARALTKLAGIRGEAREARLRALADAVRLDARLIRSRPAELSGGLKQRVAIARAFAGSPRVVVCDEPTAALDVSVQRDPQPAGRPAGHRRCRVPVDLA